ncbi:MAG: hypothetical protein JOZ19_17385 [Rubrobacter sp.]|nr:hypothetical protein [Rubrobacter sp.]
MGVDAGVAVRADTGAGVGPGVGAGAGASKGCSGASDPAEILLTVFADSLIGVAITLLTAFTTSTG